MGGGKFCWHRTCFAIVAVKAFAAAGQKYGFGPVIA